MPEYHRQWVKLRLSPQSLKEQGKDFKNATVFFSSRKATAHHLALPNYFYHFRGDSRLEECFLKLKRNLERKKVELFQFRNSMGVVVVEKTVVFRWEPRRVPSVVCVEAIWWARWDLEKAPSTWPPSTCLLSCFFKGSESVVQPPRFALKINAHCPV